MVRMREAAMRAFPQRAAAAEWLGVAPGIARSRFSPDFLHASYGTEIRQMISTAR